MVNRENSRGAITVEAAIVLPIFICVVISLAMLIKLIYIHDIVQHSIDETANELAVYSYIYHISDLQEIDEAVQDAIDDNSEQAERHAETFVNAYETMEESLKSGKQTAAEIVEVSDNKGSLLDKAEDMMDKTEDIYNAGTQLTKENLQNVKELQQIFDEVSKDPRKEIESIAWMLSKGIYSDAKSIIAVPVIRLTVKKYMMGNDSRDIDMRLAKLNIVGGFNGLDFYSSTLFDGNQDIDIIVKYKVELPLPIKLLPDIYMVQRSTARAWLDGGDGAALNQFDIWSLPNKERGVKIEKIFGGNMPYDFPVIDIYDDATKTGTSIKSINLNSKTYQSSEALNKKLLSYVNAMKESSIIKYKKENYSLLSKKLILVIPKNSINDNNRSVIDQTVNNARLNGIQITISEL